MQSASDLLDREYLLMRSRLLELAAQFDRLERAAAADGEPDCWRDDPRAKGLLEGLSLLGRHGARAEQLQMLLSLPYDSQWRAAFGINK
ncbi:MAG: hypothetical protein ACOY3P_26030 [Planctomycetota bacterium]